MQGYNLPLQNYPFVLPTETDTATPRTPIPIYYIHTFKSPFCRNPECECHRRSREVARLLRLISEGIMTLEEAAHLIEEEKEGER